MIFSLTFHMFFWGRGDYLDFEACDEVLITYIVQVLSDEKDISSTGTQLRYTKERVHNRAENIIMHGLMKN